MNSLIEKKLELINTKLSLLKNKDFEDSEIESLENELKEIESELKGDYGDNDKNKRDPLDIASDNLLESITAPKNGNPNSSGTNNKRW
ncbi:hypothetical protein [Proteiniphilum sp. UBA7639]|jgi:hypothetical protein|uniref:hypothetical protein n=1 Tax=Proteiniphilum sp. UBA7639 TaxID=1947289 RepID=UPI00257D54BC|nr:hypothetical protein [Proteiniphilum sp. UBA7639]